MFKVECHEVEVDETILPEKESGINKQQRSRVARQQIHMSSSWIVLLEVERNVQRFTRDRKLWQAVAPRVEDAIGVRVEVFTCRFTSSFKRVLLPQKALHCKNESKRSVGDRHDFHVNAMPSMSLSDRMRPPNAYTVGESWGLP